MKMKYLILGCSWCGLGFYRGVKDYNYTYNRYKKNEPYIYLNSVVDGFLGIFMYANPALLPVTIHKELYRLEVDIRNLEKDSKYYSLF